MCDPVTLGTLALSAAGAAVNGYEAHQNQVNTTNARNAATNAELARQKAYQATSAGAFNSAMGTFAPQSQATGLAGQQRTAADAFRNNAPTAAMVGHIGTGSGPAITGTDESNRVASVFGANAAKDASLGALTGYTGQNLANNSNLTDLNQGLNTTANFAGQSANISQKEGAAAAGNAARTPSGLGDLLSFGGQLLGSGRLPMPSFGGAAAPVSTAFYGGMSPIH